MSTPLWSRAIRTSRLGGGRVLVEVPALGVTRVVSSELAAALRCGPGGRTSERRLDVAAKTGPGSDPAHLRAELASLVQEGLLLDRDAILAALRAHPDSPAAPLSRVAVLTHNRPHCAARAAESALRNAAEHGRRASIVVSDDSDDPDLRAACAAHLREVARRTGADIELIDPAAKRRFVAALAEIGGPADEARFALLPSEPGISSAGANHNALTLANLGQRFLSLDDDMVCDPVPAPAPRPGVRVFSGVGRSYKNYNPAEMWFFADRARATAALRREPVDVLAAHGAVLGRSLAACAGPAGDALDLQGLLDGDMLDRLVSGRARVGVSVCGNWGDIGWYSPTWIPFQAGRTRRRLADDAAYLRACSGPREVLRVVDRLTLNDGRYCTAMVLGLDNTALIPPFMPSFRYQDGVFRMTLRTCFPDAYFAWLPHALLHDPPEVRSFDRADIGRTGAWVRVGEVVDQCILAAPQVSNDPARRLADLGAFFQELARAELPAFEAFVLARLREQKSIYLAHLDSLLIRHKRAPPAWAEDVEAHIESCLRALERPEYAAPRELLAPGVAPRDAVARLQRYVGDLGRLFAAWPVLAQATRELDRRGRGLAAALGPA